MKRKKSHAGAIVLMILALAALAIAMIIIFAKKPINILPNKDNAQETSAPVTFAGAVKVFTLSGGVLDTQDDATIDSQKQAFKKAVDFAVQHGFDAIMYEGGKGENELYYRKGSTNAAKSIKSFDKFLNKWDPLKYLCNEASKSKIGVMVYFAPENITKERADALCKAYTISGVYSYTQGTGEFGSYDEVDGDIKISAVNAASTFVGAAKLMRQDGFRGLVFGEYQSIVKDISAVSMYAALFNEVQEALPLSYTPKAELSLAYPVDTTDKLYTDTCFIMGTSNPSAPLTINCNEVKRGSTNGEFGVLVELSVGENAFTLAQGADELHFVLTRAKRTGGGGAMGQDATVELANGQMIEVATGIASALTNPSSDDNINETIKQGARATVTESVRTVRGGKKTWAYKLASGDYVLARNVKVLPDAKRASFTSASVNKTDNGEIIRFDGEGTPLCYTLREGNILTLTFYDADFADSFNITGSEFITGMSKSAQNDSVQLKLELNAANELWGWDIQYKDGTTQLFLKKAPCKSNDFAKPLSGVRVLLDAGHGDKDSGAMGVGGVNAPLEKDVNLSVALSAKYYLEKLGATVLTTRADDTFKTLDERIMMINDEAPDFFISLHHNSVELNVDANESTGTECYYFYKWHQPLADTLTQLVSEAGARNNREAHYGYYYVTRTTMAPSVLLEIGFMVNPSEYQQITNTDVIASEGAAIAQGILQSVK